MVHKASKPQEVSADFGPLTIRVRLPGDRAVTVSAFCPVCFDRRSVVGGAGGHMEPAMMETVCFVAWLNPCGHTDTAEALLLEESWQCARAGCVLYVSDADYPYCSPECAGASVRRSQ